MKDFFEDLGKRLGETAETVTSKAGDALEIQKLRSQIRSMARGNAVDLMELGKMIYDRYKEGEKVEEAAEGLCAAIRDREAEMEKYEKKIARIKGASECANCGKMVAKEMTFCPYCGEKIDRSVYEENEEDDEKADYADEVRETVADMAETVAEKAEEAAKKTAEMAEKAAEKTGGMAEKAAQAVSGAAEKAAGKVGEAAEKTAEKMKAE